MDMGAPVLRQPFGVLSGQDKKTQARVETNLLPDPSLLIFGDCLPVREKHARL